jgi:hypothetical protein
MTPVGANRVYSIYEVADVYPMHYSMLTLDKSQPGAIRTEFMTLIENEWQTNSKSTWIEIVAAPTGYIVTLDNDMSDKPQFIRKSSSPLIGSRVYMLNKEALIAPIEIPAIISNTFSSSGKSFLIQ